MPLVMSGCCGSDCTNVVISRSVGNLYCKEHFIKSVEERVLNFISSHELFRRAEKIGIGLSGGKDSVVLAHLVKLYVDSVDPSIRVELLAIDEGISGYRDESLTAVHGAAKRLGYPLTILDYATLYDGFSMDEVVKTTGRSRNCSYCGVMRRDALNQAAQRTGCDVIVTGHNREDALETYFLNLFRGDLQRIKRSMTPRTNAGTEGCSRVKPFFILSQRDIVLYAELRDLTYFGVECPYASTAFRGFVRNFLLRVDDKQLDTAVRGLIELEDLPDGPSKFCVKCNGPTGSELCTKCTMLIDLNAQRDMTS